MNILTGTARLSRDAEIRNMPNGDAVCNFNAAMDSGFGENKQPVWLRMAIFGKRASGKLPQYLVKGTQIAFSGELRIREYDDKEGNKRTSVEVSVDKLDLIGSKQDSGAQQSNNAPQQGYQQPQQTQGNGFPSHGGQQTQSNGKPDPFADNGQPVDDDIPF